jgi:short-subunit dehydrogenase
MVAIVSGAPSGIGAIYADRLTRRGCNLILLAHDCECLDGLPKLRTDETGLRA